MLMCVHNINIIYKLLIILYKNEYLISMYKTDEEKICRIKLQIENINKVSDLEKSIIEINEGKSKITKKFAYDNNIIHLIKIKIEKLKKNKKKNRKRDKKKLASNDTYSGEYDNRTQSYIGGTMYFTHPVDGDCLEYNNIN